MEYTQEELSALILKRSGIDYGQIIDLIPIARGTSGRHENMVPESATAVVSGDLADLQAKLDAFVAEHKLRGEIQEENGKYKVTIIGKSAHGAMPASGVNGATYLAQIGRAHV